MAKEQKTIEELEKELEKLKESNRASWDMYGSELCAGDMSAKESALQDEIDELKMKKELPLLHRSIGNIGLEHLREQREETVKRWEKSGLLEGLDGDVMENCAQLFAPNPIQRIGREPLKTPFVINLFAGPGTGKSTTAAQIFSALKWQGYSCELVMEFAKEKVWEESYKVLDDQLYIFGKQNHKMRRLVGKVDIIITDSPILLSLVYDQTKNKNFRKLVQDVHNEFNNFNVYFKRTKQYVSAGRMQDEEGARALDVKIRKMLDKTKTEYGVFKASEAEVKESLIPTIIGTYEQFKND